MNSGIATRVSAARVLDVVLHRGRSLKATLAAALPALADPRDRAWSGHRVTAPAPARAFRCGARSGCLPLTARDHELRAAAAGLHSRRWACPTTPWSPPLDAARAGAPHQAALVNALLRRSQREACRCGGDDAWPDWLAQRIRAIGGAAEAIFAASAGSRLRVRTGDHRDGYLERLHEAGISADIDPGRPMRSACGQRCRSATAGFDDGIARCRTAPGATIADALAPAARTRTGACAAPGGRARTWPNATPLRITALDVDARRAPPAGHLHPLEARHRRAHRECHAPDGWLDGTPFDAILIDAPQRHRHRAPQPDVLHRRETDIASLAAMQATLLDASWAMPPGRHPAMRPADPARRKNAAQVDAFLARTPDAVLEPLDASFGHDTGFGSQRLPGERGMDGFFYARLKKA
jgi:16S rRNA (cytosine967-C5)-methyltransferase